MPFLIQYLAFAQKGLGIIIFISCYNWAFKKASFWKMENSRVDGLSMSRGLKLSHWCDHLIWIKEVASTKRLLYTCSFMEVIYLDRLHLHIITRTDTTWSPTVRDLTESSTGLSLNVLQGLGEIFRKLSNFVIAEKGGGVKA